MKPDYDSLINAGLSKEEIAKISGCEDQEMQIRMLRKYRYKLLDEVHEKQQSLDAIDYTICKIKITINGTMGLYRFLHSERTQKDNLTEQKKGINCKILVEEKA